MAGDKEQIEDKEAKLESFERCLNEIYSKADKLSKEGETTAANAARALYYHLKTEKEKFIKGSTNFSKFKTNVESRIDNAVKTGELDQRQISFDQIFNKIKQFLS